MTASETSPSHLVIHSFWCPLPQIPMYPGWQKLDEQAMDWMRHFDLGVDDQHHQWLTMMRVVGSPVGARYSATPLIWGDASPVRSA